MKLCNIKDTNHLEDLDGRFCEPGIDNDNAYLHFDPEANNQQQMVTPCVSFALPRAPKFPWSPGNVSSVEPKPKKTLQSQTSAPGTCAKDGFGTKETNVRRGRKKRLVEPEGNPDELWEDARMRNVIIRDSDLHLRILRYEVSGYSICLTALLTREYWYWCCEADTFRHLLETGHRRVFVSSLSETERPS
jgi:hypothetical protein